MRKLAENKRSLLDINKLICGKFADDAEPAPAHKSITSTEFEEFRQLLALNPDFVRYLSLTDSYKEYFSAIELMNTIIPKESWEELFFAAKLGFFYEGIPCKLTYILKKAITAYDTPNNAIAAIDVRLLDKYLKPDALPEGVTAKVVLEELLGVKIELLTEFKRFVRYKDVYEVYVPDVNRVLILPEAFSDVIGSVKDVDSISYKSELGVCLHGEPIRTMHGCLGLVKDDFDLRVCV